jgi:hypothetical protein
VHHIGALTCSSTCLHEVGNLTLAPRGGASPALGNSKTCSASGALLPVARPRSSRRHHQTRKSLSSDTEGASQYERCQCDALATPSHEPPGHAVVTQAHRSCAIDDTSQAELYESDSSDARYQSSPRSQKSKLDVTRGLHTRRRTTFRGGHCETGSSAVVFVVLRAYRGTVPCIESAGHPTYLNNDVVRYIRR